jgi:hypothetical protein
VVEGGLEVHLGWFEGVLSGELKVDQEETCIVRSLFWHQKATPEESKISGKSFTGFVNQRFNAWPKTVIGESLFYDWSRTQGWLKKKRKRETGSAKQLRRKVRKKNMI